MNAAAAVRDYTLQILQFPRAPIRLVQGKIRQRHSSATVTWLYRQFVQGHLPRNPNPSQFIAVTCPFLVRAMSADAAIIMAAVFARRHMPTQQADHVTAAITQIHALRIAAVNSLPATTCAKLQSIRPQMRENATTAALICSSLADSKGRFFLDCRSLKRRLLLSQPRSALRVLERLQAAKIITKLQSGCPLWEGGQKANVYAWLETDTQ